jgi:two-component system sensor histidine kinase HydH
MVAEFLKFARPLDLQDEEVTLGPLAQRVAGEVQQSNPSAEVTAEGDFGEVTGDEGLLRQALVNLALNAVQAAAPGTRARVTLRGDIEHGPGHEFQRLTILDNGSGISPQDLPKLFLPFYTTKAAGTGLGLAIVQRIVVQHGGRVEARNAPAGGAEFIVWLPLRTPAVRTVEPETARA